MNSKEKFKQMQLFWDLDKESYQDIKEYADLRVKEELKRVYDKFIIKDENKNKIRFSTISEIQKKTAKEILTRLRKVICLNNIKDFEMNICYCDNCYIIKQFMVTWGVE